MGVITISRQLGSLGREIAALTAERLGYDLVWRELINDAARRAGAPEAALSTIDELGLLGECASPGVRRAYRRAVETVMTELADRDNVVIVGRAGQIILRDRPNVLHVRIIAPVALRAERLARRQQISLPAAEAQIQASDRFRRDHLRRTYHVRWDDPDLYDLIVNTAHWTATDAAQVIIAALNYHSTTATESAGIGA